VVFALHRDEMQSKIYHETPASPFYTHTKLINMSDFRQPEVYLMTVHNHQLKIKIHQIPKIPTTKNL